MIRPTRATHLDAATDTDDNDADGHPLKRAPQEDLTDGAAVCFLPKPKSDHDVEYLRRYAGCLGFTHGPSYQRQDGTWETAIEISTIGYAASHWSAME